jgi:hypothetical protein
MESAVPDSVVVPRQHATERGRGPSLENPYVEPLLVADPQECLFYHTMDIPGHGTVAGSWDLRPGIEPYLGGVNVAGRRVLDVGAASGYLSFHMEQQGAEVVSYDLCEDHPWDNVPYAGTDLAGADREYRANIRRVNNAYWFCHRAFGSSNRMVHGTAYTIPESIGAVDVAVFGSILLHLRDPFLALQMGTRLARDLVIVADVIPRRRFWQRWFARLLPPQMLFLPDARNRTHQGTWWMLPPQLVQRFLGVLGFEDTTLTYHTQKFEGSTRLLYTVVGRRTQAPAFMPEE